jgi:hypothetical protein
MNGETLKQYGKLTIVGEFKNSKNISMVTTKCVCGNIREFRKTEVINANVTSCHRGLCRGDSKNLANQKFGFLTALYTDTSKKRKHWICKCDCGKITSVRQDHLTGNRDKSCGCSRAELSSINNPRRLADEFGIKRLYRGYTGRAKLKNISFDLTIEQFKDLIFSNCHYCDKEPSNRYVKVLKYGNSRDITYNGIDRISPSLGYVMGNCVTCCIQCNVSKNDYSVDAWVDWIKRVYHKTILKETT